MKTKLFFKKSPLALALLATLASPAWAEDNHAHAHNESNETAQHAQQPAPDDNADHDSHDHGGASEDAHEEEAGLALTAEQRNMLNLQVITLQPEANATRTLTVPAAHRIRHRQRRHQPA